MKQASAEHLVCARHRAKHVTGVRSSGPREGLRREVLSPVILFEFHTEGDSEAERGQEPAQGHRGSLLGLPHHSVAAP